MEEQSVIPNRKIGPIAEGLLCMALMLFVVLAVIQIAIPNNWISVTIYCSDIFDKWNATRWYAGEYSHDEAMKIQECMRRTGGS